MTLKKGDWVIVNLPSNDNTVTLGMKKYNGIEVQISKVCRKKTKTPNTLNNLPSVYGYELDGVVSPYGIPYTFVSEFLIPCVEY